MRMSMILGMLFPLYSILLLSRGFFVSDAYAYLDPGTGTAILQALVGCLIGVGVNDRNNGKADNRFRKVHCKYNSPILTPPSEPHN